MARTSKDMEAFKREFRKTGSIRSSALAAGYSENCANTGLQKMPVAIRTYVLSRRKKLSKLAQLAHEFNAQEQENVVRGALLANVASGKDQAVNSLKLLGQDKRVSMFTPESTTGVIVIQAAQLPAIESVPKPSGVIDAIEGK